jgi:hypothetical protein
MTRPNSARTAHNIPPEDDKGVPIYWNPAKLRMFEERLIVAAKCGYEVVWVDDICISLAYGRATATAVRQKFYSTYSVGFVDWVAGPAPDFSLNTDLAALEALIPQQSMVFCSRTENAGLKP